MTDSDVRLLESSSFRRSTAGRDILDQIGGWKVWTCDTPAFRHQYDRAVTLYVHHGRAVVAFADGSRADLQPGDTMTIAIGASAVWSISETIRNSYIYRDAP